MLLLLLCASAVFAQATGPVTGLTAAPNSTFPSSQIDLAWSSAPGTPPITYEIHSSTTSGFTPSGGTLITTVTDPTVTYSNTGLSEATTYYYVVIAQAGAFASSEVSATTAPTAPTALSASTLGNTSVSVSWTDNSNGETGFTVEYSTDPNFASPVGTPVSFGANATAAPSAVTQTITGLTASTTYYFRVQATGTTNSTWFPSTLPSGISATTTPAAAPTSLVATAISSTQINLAWVDNSGIETSYEVERKTGVSGTYIVIASLGANTTAYSDGSLVASTAYYYRVRAVVNTVTPISYSNYSNEHSATTLPVIPNAPFNLVANATSSSTIQLSWNGTGVTGEDGFKVYRSTSPSVTIIPGNLVGSVGTDITTFIDTGLLSSTTYYYKVVAFNVSGNSAPTNEASATTFSPAPAAPSSLAANTAGSTQINVTFVDNATTESGFKIYISTTPSFIAGPTNLLATIGASAGTGLTVNYASTGLVPNTTYYYQVSAYNAGGELFAISPAEVSATTADVAPSAPTNLVANTVFTTSVLLNWTDNANNESGGFKVERKLSTAATYTEITSAVPPSAPVTATGGTIAYTDAGPLTPNTTYNYRVRAYNGGGNSAFSNVITVTTLPTPPLAPTSLAAFTISNSQIDLSWMDNSTDESNFVIERSLDNFTTTQATINTSAFSGTGTRNFSDTGLAGGTLYYYRVKAMNAGGSSAYTGIVSIATLPDPPAAPTGLMATAVSSDQINLAWTDVATETGYEVEMKQGLAGTYALVTTTGVNQITANITGLDGNTLYYFRVRATNATGASGYSNEANATTFPEGPNAAPTSLMATAMSNSQIDLTWFDNSTNEAGFKIERSASSASGPFTQIGTVGSNVQSFSNGGLVANTQYWYRVRSYNGGGDSPYSSVATATTFDNPPSPAPTSLIVTSVAGTTINLQWTDASTTEDSFRVERSMTAGGPFTIIGAVDGSVPPSLTSSFFAFADMGLNGSTQYFYRVHAKNSGGSSGPSNEVSATTGPSTPNNLFATAVSNTQVNLLWADNATNENGYEVERSLSPTFLPLEAGFPVALPANTTSYSDMTGLTGSEDYYYRVRATSLTLGNSDYSNTATVITPPNIPNPLTFTTTGNSTVNLTWNDVSPDEHGFGIQRKIGATGMWSSVDSLKRNPIPGDPGIIGTGPVTKSHTNLLSGTTYFFRVFAYNTNGSSGFTNEINLTTPQFAPNPPTMLVATGATSQITLNWVDNSNNETGFKIERSTTPGTGFNQIATVGPDFTLYTNTGITPNVVYYYRVRSYNSGGDSPYSNEASASANPDLPNVPNGLTATAVSNTQINLTWTDNSNNEVGFKIERKNGPSGTYTEIATVGAGVQAYNSTGLTGLTQYFFRIRSYNNDGNSAYTDEKDATTLIDPPGVPSGLTAAAISSSQINLSWQDNATNEDGFQVERKTGPSGTYAVIATIAPSAVLNVTHSDMTVAGSTQYFYRIRSFNVSWVSPPSNEANATTPAASIAAPTGLTATAVSSSQIDLTWVDNASNEDGYKVERSLTSGSGFIEIANLPAGSQSYSSNGLNASTQYFFRVRAYNASSNSSYSNEANATTQAGGLLPPSSLTATAVSKTQINLSWTDNSTTETGFSIEFKIGSGSFSVLTTVGANVTAFQSMGLNANTLYTYRVRATDSVNNSAYSNEDAERTWLNGPTNLIATAISTSQINLTWTETIVNETGFIVERKTGVAGSYAQVGSTLPINSTSFSDAGLPINTQFFYRVYAINSANRSEYSNEDDATTTSGVLTPTPPSNLVATGVSKNQINLTWQDNSSNETGFLIERKTGSSGTYSQIGTVGANVITFNNTGLAVNTLYFYRVRAANGSGNSAYSNEDDERTWMNGPTNLVASNLNSTQINVTWSESIVNETGFIVERKTGAAGTYAQVGSTLPQNSTSYTDNVASSATTYFYRVYAVNSVNRSEYSNEDDNSGAPPAVNLALNKPITASSTFSTSTPTRGNDGNNTSFWRSGGVSAGSPIAWLRVELGSSPVTVARVVILWNQIYYATQFEIQVSNDGTNWTIVHTNNAGTGATQDISFTPVAARYVRAYLKMPNSGSYRLVELQAYATGAISKQGEQAAAESAVIPESITLEQNYPNPFNPSTTIAFSLPAGAQVSLKVINVAGQEVVTLIDGYRDRGNHRVTFKGAKLPSGVYYAVLKAGDVTQIKRMTLAK
jgi:titin